MRRDRCRTISLNRGIQTLAIIYICIKTFAEKLCFQILTEQIVISLFSTGLFMFTTSGQLTRNPGEVLLTEKQYVVDARCSGFPRLISPFFC